jgi:choline kinase
MKALILAAGEGRRLKKYTADKPKGMLEFRGTPLIYRQVETYRQLGVKRIVIVRGYRAECIACPGVTFYENQRWQETNMVESLMCARQEFDDDIVVSYADLFCAMRLYRAVAEDRHFAGVAVDNDWQAYWRRRYGRIDTDTESLKLGPDGRILSLGVPDVPPRDMEGRYVGVIRFSKQALAAISGIYDALKVSHWNTPWQVSGKPFRQAYMTDLLQELIDRGNPVHAVGIRGGWMEFDTNEDYEQQRDSTLEGENE